MPDKIVELAKTILTDPVEVKLAVSKPADGIRQSAFICYEAQKLRIVEQLLGESPHRVIVFVGSKMKVKDVAIALKRKGFNAEAMHSDLLQEQRDDVMYRFKVGQLDILVATDIVARGIDIDDIQLVINYDVPRDEEDYVHRIGRTARAGKEGRSVTLVSEKDQPLFRDIERFLEKEVPKEPVPAEFGEAPAYTGRASGGRSGNRDRGRNRGGKRRDRHGRGGKRGARGDKRGVQGDNSDEHRNHDGKHEVSALGGSAAEESTPSDTTAAAPAKKKRTHRGGRKHKRTPASPSSPSAPPSSPASPSPSPQPAPVPDASPSGSHPSATPTNN